MATGWANGGGQFSALESIHLRMQRLIRSGPRAARERGRTELRGVWADRSERIRRQAPSLEQRAALGLHW